MLLQERIQNEDMAERWKGEPHCRRLTTADRRDGPPRPSPRSTDERARGARSPRSPSELGDAVVGSHIRARRRPLGPRRHRRRGARPARSPATSSGFTLLRLPLGHRLAAVAVRSLRGRRGRHAARRPAQAEPDELEPGYAGGDTRFQVFARVARRRRRRSGITLKADLPDDDLTHRHLDRRSTPAPTGTSARPGRCSASPSSATPTCATSTCPASSRATRCARTSRCWPAA